ncbi:Protein of unknown function [Bacillus cereus]|uniref:Uncharacterized protein n=2 Tax=Bacillus cereus group TaxID=86661 RepID=A0A1C3ZEQ8_9BACI|nr:Protein of unknown function [Bacillus wiedmannii]SCB80776.1 Protein of unknown function [Bacillus mobilis]SCB82628.1 Protein of unknown function [Bacillus cereus]SCB82883.1 Protein of unknown function [Bacillus thuringiensis]SCB82291.1 Protein of unknown function [Bacillus wiedmannii]
MRGGRHGNTE